MGSLRGINKLISKALSSVCRVEIGWKVMKLERIAMDARGVNLLGGLVLWISSRPRLLLVEVRFEQVDAVSLLLTAIDFGLAPCLFLYY